MDTYFPDLSQYQPKADIAGIRKQTDAIAARASYGATLDVTMPGRLSLIRQQGFVVSLFYLFLRARQDLQAQVNIVTRLLGSLEAGESVVIDFENDGASMPTVALRDQAADMFELAFQRPTVIYMNASTAKAMPTTRPLWVASYSNVEPDTGHVIWQKTDAGGPWVGCGLCDTNVAHMPAAELAAALGSAPSPTSQPQEDDDMTANLTVEWDDGAKTIVTPDGAIENYPINVVGKCTPAPSYGSFYDLKPQDRQAINWPLQPGDIVSATPVNNLRQARRNLCERQRHRR